MRLNGEEGNDTSLAGRTSRNTARIDRTARKVLISRGFVRAVLSWGIDRQWTVTERLGKYRLRIARIKFRCFAGLFLPLGCRGRCGRYLVSFCGIPLLLISWFGHYHEPHRTCS